MWGPQAWALHFENWRGDTKNQKFLGDRDFGLLQPNLVRYRWIYETNPRFLNSGRQFSIENLGRGGGFSAAFLQSIFWRSVAASLVYLQILRNVGVRRKNIKITVANA